MRRRMASADCGGGRGGGLGRGRRGGSLAVAVVRPRSTLGRTRNRTQPCGTLLDQITRGAPLAARAPREPAALGSAMASHSKPRPVSVILAIPSTLSRIKWENHTFIRRYVPNRSRDPRLFVRHRLKARRNETPWLGPLCARLRLGASTSPRVRRLGVMPLPWDRGRPSCKPRLLAPLPPRLVEVSADQGHDPPPRPGPSTQAGVPRSSRSSLRNEGERHHAHRGRGDAAGWRLHQAGGRKSCCSRVGWRPAAYSDRLRAG